MTIHEAIEQARVYDNTRHTDESYFDVGTSHDIVVSNSSLGKINPNEGGSERKFELYFEEQEESKTVNHIEKGRVLHRYIRDPRNFAIDDANRPSDAICTIIDESLTRTQADLPAQQGLVSIMDQMKETILSAARDLNWNNNWGNDAVFRNLKTAGEGYFNFRIENRDKIILSQEVGESVKGMKLAIEGNPAREFLLDNDDSEVTIYKELPIFWEFPSENGMIKCKSLIDNLVIDEKRRSAIITELKSTSKPVSQYMGFYRYGKHPIEGTPARIHNDGPFQYYRVYRQLGSYGEAFGRGILDKLKDGGMWSIDYRVVPVESKEPFDIQVFTPSKIWVRYGFEEFRECVDLVGRYLKNKEQD